VSLAFATDLKTVCSVPSLIPCARSVLSAYNVCAHDAIIESLLALTEKLLAMVTLRIFTDVTLVNPGSGGGSSARSGVLSGFLKIIS